MKRFAWGKFDKTKERTNYLSNKHQIFDVFLMICTCSFGVRLLLEFILGRLLSFVSMLAVRCPEYIERCPLLRDANCAISLGRTIRGMEFIQCIEVVHLLESLLLEVSL